MPTPLLRPCHIAHRRAHERAASIAIRAGQLRGPCPPRDAQRLLDDLTAWPQGSQVILRAERPHPGAQLRFTDADGHRITAVITDIPDRVIPGQTAGRELNHRQHARVEDRIREAKNTGLRNLPCRGWEENVAWLETLLAATDLVCWAKLLGFPGTPVLAHAEIATFRNLVLHVAARVTRSARQVWLRIDRTWKHAAAIADAWLRIRAAFT
jgi:Transposase DDE domain group 1